MTSAMRRAQREQAEQRAAAHAATNEIIRGLVYAIGGNRVERKKAVKALVGLCDKARAEREGAAREAADTDDGPEEGTPT